MKLDNNNFIVELLNNQSEYKFGTKFVCRTSNDMFFSFGARGGGVAADEPWRRARALQHNGLHLGRCVGLHLGRCPSPWFEACSRSCTSVMAQANEGER